MHNFKNLDIWKDAVEFVSKIYLLTEKMPISERYGLIPQIQRAAVSIPSNIAEGTSRASNKEFAHFLSIAIGSSYEVETQFIIAQKLNLIEISKVEELFLLLESIQRRLFRFKQKISLTPKKES